MKLNRRSFFTSATTAGFLAATDVAAAQNTALFKRTQRTFILVHGSWHNSGVWERITYLLVAAGHVVIARDLPGRGLNASFPQTYFQRPLDAVAYAQERSPVAGVTLDDDIASLTATIRGAIGAGSEPVILVGHSSGGFTVTPVAERYPRYISDVVYLAGFMPDAGVAPNQDLLSDDNENNRLLAPVAIGDPTITGALRFDWNSNDPVYARALQDVFYNDIDVATYRPVANLLTPDDPFQPFTVPTVRTAQRWGSIRRSYIRTARDHAILPALQDRWIAQADALTPSNPTTVYRLDSSHSPFISQPKNLFEILLDVANRSY